LLLVACRHIDVAKVERRSTEAEIRQHIVGEWKIGNKTDVGRWIISNEPDNPVSAIIIGGDGSLTQVFANGTKVLYGTWELLYGNAWRVTPTKKQIEDARILGMSVDVWECYPVVYVDDHELIMGLGPSMAGDRSRYAR